jgi:AcrR family transcriptional regulator
MSSAAASLDLVSLSVKEQLIQTAERLFAVHGLEGVSLRQIASEAGSANTSAVHYHFGAKARLIEAILIHRLPHLNHRREILAELSCDGDLRSDLEAYLLPMLEQAQIEDSYYLNFIEQLISHAIDADPLSNLPAACREPHARFARRLGERLAHLPEPVRSARIRDAMSMALHIAAARERALRAGSPVVPLRLQIPQLLDALVGLLEAPVSDQTLAALAATPSSGHIERVGEGG